VSDRPPGPPRLISQPEDFVVSSPPDVFRVPPFPDPLVHAPLRPMESVIAIVASAGSAPSRMSEFRLV